MGRGIKVTLAEGYYVEIDSLNYTLKQRYRGKTKDGLPRNGERTIGYYGNLRQCVESYIAVNQLDQLAGKEMPLVQYVRMVENANKKVLNELGGSLQGIEDILKWEQ